MNRTKIAIYLVLIFLAGAIAGGAVVLSSPETFGGRHGPRRHGSPEEMANHFWNGLKERLELTEEQIPKVEPIFREGFDEVRGIMDRSVQEVEAAIRRNHAKMGEHLTEAQREELKRMHEERQNFIIKRKKRDETDAPKP